MGTECEPGGHTTQCSTQQFRAVQGPFSHSTTHVSAPIPTRHTPKGASCSGTAEPMPTSPLQSSFVILL